MNAHGRFQSQDDQVSVCRRRSRLFHSTCPFGRRSSELRQVLRSGKVEIGLIRCLSGANGLDKIFNQGRTHKAARKALSAECIFYAVQNHKGNCRSFGRLPEVGIFSISWWLVSSNLGHLEEILLRVDSNSLRGSGFSQVWAGHFAIHQEALAQGLLCESDHLHPTGSN